MKGSWNQKLCAVATVSMLLSSAPVGVLAQENARITQSDPEEVYVDIIGDGQRTTLFNENWKFHRGDINDAQNKDYNDSTWETVNLPHDYIKISQQAEKQRVVFYQVALAGIEKLL